MKKVKLEPAEQAEGVIKLDEDDHAVALRHMTEMGQDINELYRSAKKSTDEMPLSHLHNVLAKMQYEFSDLSKLFKFQGETAREVEMRHLRTRQLNEQVRELTKQLGEKQPLDGLQAQIKTLNDKFRGWWRSYGFSMSDKFELGEYGILIRLHFGCNFWPRYSSKPVTQKNNQERRVEWLKKQGLESYHEEGGGDLYFFDTEENRKKFLSLVRTAFPSAEARDWKSVPCRVAVGQQAGRSREFKDRTFLREIEFHCDYDDLQVMVKAYETRLKEDGCEDAG